MKITAVVMAGGKGERFWPESRENHPKQFLSLTGDGVTMIQKTVRRISPVVQNEDIFIVTNSAYKNLVREQLPEIPPENILSEPCGRNTAPCIAFAGAIIRKKYGNAVMLVLPSDHLIKYENIFTRTLCNAIVKATEGDNLLTIGITPTYAETGYGYINFSDEDGNAYKVEKFVEKPDLRTAKKYLASGKYLWNSGMFVWKVSAIMECFARFMPDIFYGTQKIADAYGTPDFETVLETEYNKFPSESIDFGIMEKAENIFTIPGSFGWDDVGSWLAIERINETDDNRNFIKGDVIAENCKRSTICGGKRLVAVVGMEDTVIVDTDDVLLVCSKNSTQDIKKIIAKLKENNRTEFI
ncbi:MAG: NTP transferase domain-containing protein [Ruminococcus sp.]|nr:NTP transferase domain-containing protein [Ruminococcus sp.]